MTRTDIHTGPAGHDVDPNARDDETQPLPSVLAAVVNLSRVDMASVSLVDDGHTWVAACTDDRARRIDTAQHGRSDGPWLESVQTRRTVFADITQIRMLWPDFARTAREEHVLSFLIVPLVRDDRVMGTLSLYSESSHSFDGYEEKSVATLTAPLVTTLSAAA